MTSLLWDQHTCLPLRTDADVDPLTRYQQRAGAFVSVNAGYSPHSFRDAKTLLPTVPAAGVWTAPMAVSPVGDVHSTGVGIFLGPNTPTLEAMTRHLEYAVELVGINHVGISTDFSFDYADLVDEITRNPHLFDDSYTRWGPIQWMPPETLLMLGEYLTARGWITADVDAVLGGNFSRVAQRVWRN